jgi:hypothetical protein
VYDAFEAIVLAKVLEGTSCPVCEEAWTCGQDVHDRNPTLEGSVGICSECFLVVEGAEDNRDQMALSHLHQCMEERDRLSSRDHEFLANAFGITEVGGDLDSVSCERLFHIHQKLFEEKR